MERRTYEGTCTQRRNVHERDIDTEGHTHGGLTRQEAFTWRRHAHGEDWNDIHTKRHTNDETYTRSDIYME